MLTWLLLLAPIVAVIIIVRVYKKKSAEREAASSKRFDEIFGGAVKSPQSTSPSAPALPRPMSAAVTPAVPAWTAKARFLEPQGKLLYYLLKSELPDHEIFAHIGLNAVLFASPAGLGAQGARKPPEATIDFLVCDKQMKPVAAVQMKEALGSDAVAESIESAGLRCVAIVPGVLPARDQVRGLVLGT